MKKPSLLSISVKFVTAKCQMHLLFPEVIILSSFLYDLAVTLGGGSNLFLALVF